MTEEDEEFNRIERESMMRMKAVAAVVTRGGSRTTIEMAREAGLRDCTCDGARGCLERLIELVRADERARMAEQPAQDVSLIDEGKTTLDKMADNAKELGLDYEPATYTFKQSSEPVFAFTQLKPNHNMTFNNQDGKQVGTLDFNGPEMTFTGDADESAKVFFDFIARSFRARLDQERADERDSWPAEMEAMERQVNILTDALAQARREP